MTISDNSSVTVAGLREILGLAPERPDGVRDLLAVPRSHGEPVPDIKTSPWQLALGDWPEAWRAEPGTGPRYLVMLRGLTAPYLIATVEDIDISRWGEDEDADPSRRLVPVRGTAYAAAAVLAGSRLETGVSFGWQHPEEQYAFL
ncbi:MAG TPA: hypothetical protein VN969_42830 [Streptosporangiaceae bacterium]|nr:hypothetical protein [Streptosporangiaceae bacterium]